MVLYRKTMNMLGIYLLNRLKVQTLTEKKLEQNDSSIDLFCANRSWGNNT